MRGLTFIELLVTLGILSILSMIAAPAFQSFVQSQRIKSAVRTLHNDLAFARSEAIVRDLNVVACPGSPSTGCTGGTDWSEGWIIFSDENADTHLQSNEELLRRGQGQPPVRIRYSRGRQVIRFSGDGSTPGSNGSMVLCGGGGPSQARKLVISNIGRIRRDLAPDTDPADCPN